MGWVFLTVLLLIPGWGGMATALEIQSPAVALEFEGVPSNHYGSSLSFSVHYTKPVDVVEQRLVFRIQLRRAADDSVIEETIRDNNGHGYGNDEGTLNVTLPLPGDRAPVYVAAFAVPWSLNRAIVQKYQSYPTDGTYPYQWISGSYGVTQDVYYLGTLIAPTIPSHTTYCSGVTFEAFLLAFNGYNSAQGHPSINGMAASSMSTFRTYWYGATSVDREKLTAYAITQYNLGEEITNWEDVQEGDFVQFWRHSGSGHSVIFVGWVRDTANTITGIRYWSSQSSTNGIGIRSESFGTTSGVNPNRVWPARVRKPRDNADFGWALGEASTQDNPTLLIPAGCLMAAY